MKYVVTITVPGGVHPPQQDHGSLAIAIEELTDTWFQEATSVTIERKRTHHIACPECGRVFDLTDSRDASEWAYGHDCEA